MARLTQIIDRAQILSLQKRLTNTLGMSVVFEEPNGGLLNVVGQRGGVCKACTDFIDLAGTGRKRCLHSDSDAASKAQGGLLTRPSHSGIVVEFYVCNGRLRNFVIPVSIGGEVIGNVFSGQFLVRTLEARDPDFDSMLSRMQQLGVTRNEALTYASMPEEDEILQIAKDNNIPTERWPAFKTTYTEMFSNAKPLSYVIDAVYLLSEVAQTLSALGNAYFYNDICTKLTAVVPDQLRRVLTDDLEQLGSLVQTIGVKPSVDLSTEMAGANQLIHGVLSEVEIYESTYLRDLLLPYDEGLAPVTSQVLELQRRLLIARLLYASRTVRTILNKALRDKTLSPGMYSSDDKRLFDAFDSQLQVVEGMLSDEPLTTLEHSGSEEEVLRPDAIMEIKDKLTSRWPGLMDQQTGLDDIESLLALIRDADFGLKRIREGFCDARVLDELPMPIADLRRRLRLGYDVVCLNWGGISSSLDSVGRDLSLWSAAVDRHGPVSLLSEELLESPAPPDNVLSSVRETVASLVKCEPGEVVLTHNTTHGVALALSSMDFVPQGQTPPDRILVTNCEHDTVFHCIKQSERKFSVIHETLNLSDASSSTSIIDDIVSKSSDGKTKVVIASHVTFNTGQVLSIAEIIQGVRDILADKTPLFLIDGAQAVGHIPVDVGALNCDFYAADAHKWLMGPRGSGFLYVKEPYLAERSGHFGFYEHYMVADAYRPRYEERGRIYEPATMSVETYVGMKAAIEAILDIHHRFPDMYQRIVSLSQTFRQLAEQRLRPYGVQLTDHDGESGLVTVSFRDHNSFDWYDEIRRGLDRRFHILARALDSPPCLRFSVGYLNSEWEIKLAVLATEKLLEETPEFAEAKARVDEEQGVLQRKRNMAADTIKTAFEAANDAISTRDKEGERRLRSIRLITKGKRTYETMKIELQHEMQSLLKRVEESVSEEELEELKTTAESEINRIVYGEQDQKTG